MKRKYMKYFDYLDAVLPAVLKPVMLLPHAPSHVNSGPRDGTFGSKKTRKARSGFSANVFLVPRRYGSGVTSHIPSKMLIFFANVDNSELFLIFEFRVASIHLVLVHGGGFSDRKISSRPGIFRLALSATTAETRQMKMAPCV